MSFPFRHARAALAAVALLTVTCRDVEVTAVDPARIEISPATPTVQVDETVGLTARVLSDQGRVLPGRSVEWRSLDEQTATVDGAGTVSGVAAGTARIRAATGALADTAEVTVTPGPVIAVAPAARAFTAVQGAAAPAAQTIAISNAGTGTLSTLGAAITYAAGQPTGWLTATLGATSAPATLALSVDHAALAPGAFSATVAVTSPVATNGPVTVAVTLTVLEPGPALLLQPASLTFDAVRDGASPAVQNVAVTNAGGGTLDRLAIAVTYPGGQPSGWLTPALSGSTAPATLSVGVTLGSLAAGTYTGAVRVSSPVATNATQLVDVTLHVEDAAPAIGVSTSTVSFAADVGGTNPAAVAVDVTNTGGGTLGGLSTSVAYDAGQPTGWLTATLAATTAPTTLTLAATTGSLPIGSYTARVLLAAAAAANTPATITVTFSIGDVPPSAPTALTAAVVSASQIHLEWGAAGGTVEEYRVERSTGTTGTWTQLASVSTSLLTYESTGLAAATQYLYRVRACNDFGCSPYSNEATATTHPLPPGTPGTLTATTASSSTIDLAWGAASGTVATYVIERRTGTGAYTVIDSVAGATTLQDTGLAPATSYTYRVRACNAGGCSAYGNEASATTLPDAPGAPASLSATTASSSAIDLDWTAASGTVDEYRIERRTGPETTFTLRATVAGTATALQDAGLDPGTMYTYRVQACNTGGCSLFSSEAAATTYPLPPGTPGTLTATAVSSSAISLAWGASSGTVGEYVIERRTGTGAYAVIDSVAGTTAFQDTGLAPATAYTYRVRACNPGGCSAYGNEAGATTLPATPGAPSSLAAAAASSSAIDLDWAAGSGTVAEYRIERRAGAETSFTLRATIAGTATSYQDAGLTAATGYVYRVQACNVSGCSPFSNEASATTLPLPPGAPGTLSATTASSSQVDLAWGAATGTVAGYVIERRAGAGAYAVVDTAAGTTYADAGLAAATTYTYRVRACNSGGCSPYSNEAVATTYPPAPGAPTALTATTTSSTQIQIAWTAATGTVDGYVIERRTGPGAFAVIDTVTGTSFLDSGLAPATSYTYHVQACNAGGCSEFSNQATATTFPLPPGTPGTLTATTISTTRIDLAWGVSSGTVAGYVIERRTGAGVYAVIDTVSGATTFQDLGLTPGTSYVYRVQACNAGGCSAYGNEAAAATLPNPPGAPTLTALAVDTSAIDLSWSGATGTVESYRVERVSPDAAVIAVLDDLITSHDDLGLSPGTAYTYRVQACNTGGCSPYSNEVTDTTYPGTPQSLTAQTVDSAQIQLAWTASVGITTTYAVERSEDGVVFADTAFVPGGTTQFTDTGLSSETQYFYRVRACNSSGCSPYTAPVDATTDPGSGEIPEAVALTGASGRVGPDRGRPVR